MNKILKNETEFCGRVPLHQTNLLQPHGYLLVVDAALNTILQAGENVDLLLGQPAREVVGQSLAQFISEEAVLRLQQRSRQPVPGRIPFLLPFPSGEHLVMMKVEKDFLLLEVEGRSRAAGDRDSFLEIYQHLKYAMAAIEATQTTEETCRVAIEELKAISGFDKLMVYRFDAEWHGDVIAEVMEEGMDSYLGLKFPSSDVPRQARELYRKTPYRLIPNVQYEAVKLYPVINPVTNVFTDLSDSNLRSVAGVHLEYLKNMKVQASMSTRILCNGELWGLIACHHRTPRYLSFEMCAIFEWLSDMISARISSMLGQDLYRERTKGQELLQQFTEAVFLKGDLDEVLLQRKHLLLDLLQADGVVMNINGQYERVGEVPDETATEDLVIWLQSNAINRIYQQQHLSAVYEPALQYTDVASGLLALPVQADRGEFILAFRKEQVQTVNWGGNPYEALQFENNSLKYHPRKSFDTWQQDVRHTAKPWSQSDLELAEQFRSFIVEFSFNRLYRN